MTSKNFRDLTPEEERAFGRQRPPVDPLHLGWTETTGPGACSHWDNSGARLTLCQKPAGHDDDHDTSTPCPSKAVAVLGLPEPVTLPCGLAKGHVGQHRYLIEWRDA